MSTLFFLLRHASHDHLGTILTGRMAGVRLSERGRAEARALGRQLRAAQPRAICTSPRLRARETGERIAAATGLAYDICEELDEIDFGAWSGRTFAALREDPAWIAWNEERDTARTPGGESMRDVAGRLVGLLDRLRRQHRDGPVLLVSHQDVIKAGVCHYLGLPFGHMQRFEVSPASVTRIAVGDSGAGTVLAVNEACESHAVPGEAA